jgi:hypothetical protein
MKDFACDKINNKVLPKNSCTPIGKVIDLIFDDVSYKIRFIMTSVGSWLDGKTV